MATILEVRAELASTPWGTLVGYRGSAGDQLFCSGTALRATFDSDPKAFLDVFAAVPPCPSVLRNILRTPTAVAFLTETRIRAARASDRPYKLFDERGLFMLVTPSGGRLWRFRYRMYGREKLISLGAYPDVTLKRAREKRDEARKLVADGIDPSVRRKAERGAGAETFEAVAKEWLELQSKALSEETISILGTRLKSFLYPYIGNRPVVAITAQELLGALRRIEARGRHETAHRVRALAGRVLRYAVATGRAPHDVAADLRDALAPVKSRNFASLTDPARVGELLLAIDSYDGQPVTALALRLAPLVFVRPGELRAAEWSEFDLANAEWRIPANRMKMGEQHIVPLARQAVAILRELAPLARRVATYFRRSSPATARCRITPSIRHCGGSVTQATSRRVTDFAVWRAPFSTSRDSRRMSSNCSWRTRSATRFARLTTRRNGCRSVAR